MNCSEAHSHPSEGLCSGRVLVLPVFIIKRSLPPPRTLLRSVHLENSTEEAQEQGPLQEDQEQEVDPAEQGPVGDTGTDGEPHILRERPGTLHCPSVPGPMS